MRVSARELEELASENIGTVELTFENTSDRWVHISQVDLDFGKPTTNDAVAVVSGPELHAWQQGAQLRAAQNRQKANGALVAVALGGLFLGMAGVVSDTPGLALAGDLVLTGSLVTAAARDINDDIEAAQTVPVYPENHLFAVPFAIPPRLAVKKFLVLDTGSVPRQSCLAWIYVRFHTRQGPRERVLLRFRYPGHGSDWTNGVCS
jgi:hypothetical protein